MKNHYENKTAKIEITKNEDFTFWGNFECSDGDHAAVWDLIRSIPGAAEFGGELLKEDGRAATGEEKWGEFMVPQK